jgi:hypothetical protein
MSILRSAFQRIFVLRVWVLATGLLVLGGVTTVVAQTNANSSGSSTSTSVMVSTLAGSGRLRTVASPNIFPELGTLSGIVSDQSGTLYSQELSRTGHRISPAGEVTAMPGIGKGGSGYPLQGGLAIDTAGTIYFSTRDVGSGETRIGSLSASGVGGVLFSGAVASLGPDDIPMALTVNSAGVVYVIYRGPYSANLVSISPSGVPVVLGPIHADGQSIVMDRIGNIYTSSSGRIFRTSVAGVESSYGDGDAPRSISGLAFDPAGNLYASDGMNDRILRITPAGIVATIAGFSGKGIDDGPVSSAQFDSPAHLTYTGGKLYVADSGTRVRVITGLEGMSSPAVTTTTAVSSPTTTLLPSNSGLEVTGSVFAGSETENGYVDGQGSVARLKIPDSVAVDPLGNVYFSESGLGVIRKATPGGSVSTVAGLANTFGHVDGPPTVAKFSRYASVLAVDKASNIYVGDSDLLRVVSSGGTVSTIDISAAVLESLDNAKCGLRGATVDILGNVYVLCDLANGSLVIYRISLGNQVTTVGSLASADSQGGGLTVDSLGNLYFSEAERITVFRQRIMQMNPQGKVSIFAGSPGGFSTDGPRGVAVLDGPSFPRVGPDGNVYVLEPSRVRKISTTGYVSTLPFPLTSWPNGLSIDSSGNLYTLFPFVFNPSGTVGSVIYKISVGGVSVTTTTVQSASSTVVELSTTTTSSIPAGATTTVPEPLGVLTARIVRGANSEVGASVYTVTLRMAGVVSGASYEFVVPSGHVPEPLPPDPTTHRYPKTAVDGVVEWVYSLKVPRGVFSAQVFSAGSSFALSSVEVK